MKILSNFKFFTILTGLWIFLCMYTYGPVSDAPLLNPDTKTLKVPGDSTLIFAALDANLKVAIVNADATEITPEVGPSILITPSCKFVRGRSSYKGIIYECSLDGETWNQEINYIQ